MAIPEYARANFETLMKAAKAGDLALMECTEVVSGGGERAAFCARSAASLIATGAIM